MIATCAGVESAKDPLEVSTAEPRGEIGESLTAKEHHHGAADRRIIVFMSEIM